MKKEGEKTTLKKAPRGSYYSTSDKIAALKLIEVNGSIYKTSKQTGIARPTLTKWAEDPDLACKAKVDLPKIEQLVNKRIEKTEVDILTEVHRIKIAALHRMEVLIGKSDRLKDVTDAFAVLSGVSVGDMGIQDAQKGQQIVQNIKQSIQQRIYMVQQNNERDVKRTIEINGNTEEQEATEV